MDEGATNHWDKCVVAQATLNDTLSYNRAADMPFLSSFVNIELEELRTLVCTIYRMVARYRAVVSRNETIYRR